MHKNFVMKKNLFLLFFVLSFSFVLSAETSLFIEYLSENEKEVALSLVGRIEIKDEIFRLIDINGEELASCDLYEVRKIVFQESSVMTNVDDLDTGSFVAVYPNPTQDVLFVEGLKSNDTVRVYDLNGTLISISESNKDGVVMLSVSNLPEGVYLLQVGVEIVKFIKQ
jgi:hypothetical protein